MVDTKMIGLKCSNCKTVKNPENFYKSSNKRGFRYYCKECEKIKNLENTEKQKLYNKKWYSKNKEKYRKKKINYKNDMNILLKTNIRNFFIASAKKQEDSQAFKETFGFSVLDLKKFEEDFAKGMKWSNIGNYWSFYNIIPESAYNFSLEEDIKKCWSIRNLYVCINENYDSYSVVDMKTIKEKNILDLMPDVIVFKT